MNTLEKAAEVILFKNVNGNCSIVLKSLAVIAFVGGKFWTTNAKLQAEMKAAAEEGEFGLYIDQNEASIDPDAATPLDQLRKKFREEMMAELKAGGKLVDGGSSVTTAAQTQQSMAATTEIVGAGDLSPEQQAIKDAQAAGTQSALDKLNAAKAGK